MVSNKKFHWNITSQSVKYRDCNKSIEKIKFAKILMVGVTLSSVDYKSKSQFTGHASATSYCYLKFLTKV